MKANDSKRIVKLLSLIWFLSLQLMGHLCSTYISDIPLTQLSVYHYIILGYVFLYSCPLLLSIRRHAIAAEMKLAKLVSTLLIGHHTLWVVLTFIEVLK